MCKCGCEEFVKIGENKIPVYRVDNDINGNPRYVIHFLSIADTYEDGVKLIRKIGGRKYKAKWFGGGLIFSSYNILEDLKQIVEH